MIRIWHGWIERLPEMSSHVSELIPLLECILDRDAQRARELAINHVVSFQKAVTEYS